MEKRIISVFIPSLAGGGAERIAIFVADALDKAGYDVDLVYARNRGPLAQHSTVRKLGVSLDAVSEMFCLAQLVRYLRQRQPDLVIALVHSAKIMAGLARYFVPQTRLAISVHANLLAPRRYRFWLRRFFGFGLERRLYRHAIAAHAVSQELAEQVVRCFGIARQKSFMIYNPIDESEFSPVLPAHHEPLFDRPVILAAGRLVPQKDHAALIRSFAASGLVGSCRLVILGEGPLRPDLERQIRDLKLDDAVALPGHVPDVRPYLGRSGGYALSSRFEGLPLVLLEALKAGLPIVSYACSCGPAEILVDGKLGCLVPPGDEAGLARALKAMMDGQRPSQDAIDQQLAKFSPDIIRAQYIALVEHCLSQPADSARR